MNLKWTTSQQTFTCSNLTIAKVEKDVKYIKRHQNDFVFQVFSSFSTVHFEQVNVCWDIILINHKSNKFTVSSPKSAIFIYNGLELFDLRMIMMSMDYHKDFFPSKVPYLCRFFVWPFRWHPALRDYSIYPMLPLWKTSKLIYRTV